MERRRGVSLLGAVSLLVAILVAPRPATAHKVRVWESSTAKSIVEDSGQLLADYGSYRLYEVDRLRPDLLQDDKAEVRDDYNRILLDAARIDTTTKAVKALRKPVGDFNGKRMHLIQFVGPVQPAWREALKKTGAQIISYIPQNAYLVYGDAQALAKLQSVAGTTASVQWNGAYLDDYRIHPRARTVDAQGRPRAIGTDEFAIQLVDDAEANAATLQLIDRLKLEPIKRQQRLLNYLNLIVRLAPDSLPVIAAQPEVVSIHPHFPRKKACERQDQIVAGNLSANVPSDPVYLDWLAGNGFATAQFDASGFVVDVSDSGIDDGTTTPNHFALYVGGDTNSASRVVYNRLEGTPNFGSTLQGCDGHGNINAHIIGGYSSRNGFPHTDASGFHYGLGICPFVRLGSSVIFDPDRGTNPDNTDLQSRAYRDGARISNNSWGAGSPGDGSYDMEAQEFDILVRDAQPATAAVPVPGNQQMVIVFSAGNDGPSATTITTPGTAKNVICVGAAESVQAFGGADGSGVDDTGADSANDVHTFSSRGPCQDGRHKPDLMAPGTHISGGAPQAPFPGIDGTGLACFDVRTQTSRLPLGVSGGVGGARYHPPGQQFYTASTGTSHAAPAVSGACALLRQYFLNNFGNAPSPAMTKAFLMNSARYLTGQDANDTLWSDSQGMGELNLGTAFDGVPRILRDQLAADIFTASGQTRTFTGTISDLSKPFRVTVAWTDAPGSTTGSALNNDLDLTVTVGGNTYKGNVFRSAYSVTGGAADHQNNVESVFLPTGTTGNFTVTITAANINSDGVPGDADPLDQDFALVIYNSASTAAPNIVADTTALVAESCMPTNGAIDPGETVTVNFSLKNVGTADTGNLVATLLATGGVSTPSGPQTFGALTAGGSPVARPFTFTASGVCSSTITNTFQLQDGASDLGVATFILPLGEQTIDFAENFDEVTPPALPSGWATSATGAQSHWVTSTGSSDTPPNAAFSPDPDSAGVNELDTPPIPIATASAQLTFRHSYSLEASSANPTVGYDGGVLEIKIGNGSYADIISAGGSFITGGYDHTISSSYGNPLAGRPAWSGDSAGFVTTIVNLPASAKGQNVQLRWRCGTDSGNSTSVTGWFVDTVTISELACCTGSGANTNGAFAAVAGLYQGLVQSNSPSQQASGFISITVSKTGSFFGKVTLGGASYSVKETFDDNGNSSSVIPRAGTNSLTLTLHLDLTNGTDQITGMVSDGTFTSDLTANLTMFNQKTNPAKEFQGYYTVLLPPNPDETGPDLPQGNGYGTLKVDAGGNIRFSATLGDGTRISQTAVVSKDGTWPVYIPLYVKKGSLSGWVTFTNVVGVSDLGGMLSWFKQPVPAGKFYPNGFATEIMLLGSEYTAPPVGTPVLDVTNTACNILVTLGGGNLDSFVSNSVTLTAAKKVFLCVTNGFRLMITPNTGLFSGSFINPATHKSTVFRGALFQKQNIGAGFFLGTSQTGFVTVEPSP
ncbi:MAG: S8 family serine peptidase [Verrucomicrobiia bacterium]